MKVRIEIEDDLLEEEVVIRCRQLDKRILHLQAAMQEIDRSHRYLKLIRGDTEYFIPQNKVLFFETEEKTVFVHTANHVYETPYRLYELEEMLPGYFMRISKSTIVNLNHIYSITRNLTASSIIEFSGSVKKVYVSRHYYKALIERMAEKRKSL